MRGRKPKPAAIKKLAGNPGKRPLSPDPELPAAGDLQPPAWLAAEAKREWQRVARDLQTAGVLMSTDITALAAYCQMYARWKDAEQHVRKEGAVIKGVMGGKVRNPWVTVSKQAFDVMRVMMAELGLTPSARGRVKGDAGDIDPFEEFVRSRLGDPA